MLNQMTFPTTIREGTIFLKFLPALIVFTLFKIYIILTGERSYLIVADFPHVSDEEHFFIYLLAICVSFLKCLFLYPLFDEVA